MLADAGTATTLQPLGITDKRIPTWLLPGAPSRPDIVIVHARPADLPRMRTAGAGKKRSAAPPQARPRVTIVEVTYQCDHIPPGVMPQGRHQVKSQLHATTTAQLEARGHQVDYQAGASAGTHGTIHLEIKKATEVLGIPHTAETAAC
jgi:hypothetical protein